MRKFACERKAHPIPPQGRVLLIALPAVEIMEKYVLYVLDVLFLIINQQNV